MIVCQSIVCANPDPLEAYSLNGLPPAESPSVQQPQVFNQAVYYPVGCDEGEELSYDGTLPGWISIDTANSRLVGASGVFASATLLGANSAAQEALESWAQEAITAGALECSPAFEFNLAWDTSFTGIGTSVALNETPSSATWDADGTAGIAFLTAEQSINLAAPVSCRLTFSNVVFGGDADTISFSGVNVEGSTTIFLGSAFGDTFADFTMPAGTFTFRLTLSCNTGTGTCDADVALTVL